MLSNCEVCGIEYDSDDLYRGMCSDCLSDEMFKAILDNPVPKKNRKKKFDDEKEN
jgi:hypothetical protein